MAEALTWVRYHGQPPAKGLWDRPKEPSACVEANYTQSSAEIQVLGDDLMAQHFLSLSRPCRGLDLVAALLCRSPCG